MYELIVAAVMALPVYKEDVGDSRKPGQLEMIAGAVHEAASRQRWAGSRVELEALELTVAYHESGFSLRIHAGECRPLECDRGRARGLWQPHRTRQNEGVWETLTGLDQESTLRAAREAARALAVARWTARSKAVCDGVDPIAATLSVYAGRRCDTDWKGLAARMRTYRWLLGRLTAPAPKR